MQDPHDGQNLPGDIAMQRVYESGVLVVFGRKVALRNNSFSFIGLQS
jgi:hypothetical protein